MTQKGPSNTGDGRLTEVAENEDEGSEIGTIKTKQRKASIVSRASEKGLKSKDRET